MSSNVAQSIVDTILAALPERSSYGLHEPYFNELEEKNVVECIRTGWVSYQGSFVKEFEAELARIHNCKHAIAVSNGTTALFIALQAVGVKPNDEVLIPSLTFVATANAVSHADAIPHLIDSSYTNLGIDVAKLETYLQSDAFELHNDGLYNSITGNKVCAIVPVHVFGHPVDLDPLIALANKYHLKVVEDAAESLGSRYKGAPVGCRADIGIVSFNGNKIVTTGGGGAILVNDDGLATRIKHITTTAKLPHQFEFVHDEIGYNFRMPNINAAIGVAQLSKLQDYIKRKRLLAQKYSKHFADNEFFTFINDSQDTESNYWLNAILLNQDVSHKRDEILEYLHANNIFARPLWRPMHMLEIYKDSPRMKNLDVAEDLYRRVICLPSSVFLYDK